MPTRASKKRPRDINVLAAAIVKDATDPQPEPEDTRNPFAVGLSKLGAAKGGKARAKSLNAAERREIALKGARARWRRRAAR